MELQEEPQVELTDQETNTLIAWYFIDIFTYGLTLAYAFHNTYRILCL